MSSGTLAIRSNGSTQRLRGSVCKKRSQDKKVLAKNNAIFVKGNSLPHALTFEMYEANVRDNLYNKNRGTSIEENSDMNHSRTCNCTLCLESEMGDLQLDTKEIKDCLNVQLQNTFDTASINHLKDSGDTHKTMDLSSNNSIEALVNYYTLRYQNKRNNTDDTQRDHSEQNNFGGKYFADSPLVNDEFDLKDIEKALSATSTPIPGKSVANNTYPLSYEEYSVNEISASLLNNSNEASSGAETPYSNARILVGLIGRCKIIDCDLNDNNIPRPEYRKYSTKRIFNTKTPAVAALNIQSPPSNNGSILPASMAY